MESDTLDRVFEELVEVSSRQDILIGPYLSKEFADAPKTILRCIVQLAHCKVMEISLLRTKRLREQAITNELELWFDYLRMQNMLTLLSIRVNPEVISELELLKDSKTAIQKTTREYLSRE